MSPRRRRKCRDRQIIREEVLRPSHYLGYDRDEMGRYFLGRGALELAESQFRRAVWLNPYEPAFKVHWAIALIQMGLMDKARDLLEEILHENPNHGSAGDLWDHYWPQETRPKGDMTPHGFPRNHAGTE